MKIICPRMIVGNRGDLLSRFGILSALREIGHEEVTVFCAAASDLPAQGYETLPYGSLYNLLPTVAGWRALLRSDLMLWTGGLDLQDDSSLVKLLHFWLTFLSYRALGLRIVACMQGAGPLSTRAGRWLARRVLNLVDCFIARDSGTYRLLEGLGVSARLVRADDGIFLPGIGCGSVAPDEDKVVDRLVARASGQPLLGFNLRLWFHFRNSILPYHCAKGSYQRRARQEMGRLLAAATELIGRLRGSTGARVVLLSMYEPDSHPWEDDLPYLQEIKQAFGGDEDVVVAAESLGLAGVCRLVSQFDLMIGARLHSTLLALRLGVPAINLAYTLKCRDIFGDLGLAPYAAPLEEFISDPACVAKLAVELLGDGSARDRIRALVAARVDKNMQIFREALGGSAPAVAGQAWAA